MKPQIVFFVTNHIKHLCTSLLLLIYFISAGQQISVDNSLSAQQLVENTLAQECVIISNINSSINGDVIGIGSFGYFERENSNFPFLNGMVLTTGNANSAGNTINTNVLNEGDSSWGTDSDLESTLGVSNTTNATSIEFNFTSVSSVIGFNYIYASEEYFANFPCDYSDRFAFLIREAGTNNAYTNIALVPGTNLPVNSTNIHDEIDGFCLAENEQYFEGNNVGDTNYNGRTTVLTAVANVTPNIAYEIKLVIADQTDRNYDSAVFIEANSFTPTVELGEDFTTCASTVDLDGDINNSNAQYQWFVDGNPISGATQPLYQVTTSGTYNLEINIPLGNGFCTIGDEITIILDNSLSTSPMTNIEQCDDISEDGEEIFNLNSKDNEALDSVPPGTYTISYHASFTDAENNLNPISGNYSNTSNPQTIYVRIEDTINGCIAINPFNLVVNTPPMISQPPLLEVCDNDGVIDGFTAVDLSQANNSITGGQNNLIVNYHFTQADAEIGANPLPIPYVNDSVNDQVFVSVTNSATGCISTTTLDISVLEAPALADTTDTYIDACETDDSGFADFDLTEVEPEILNGLTNVDVTYHLTLEDAQTGDNPISNPTNFTNTEQFMQTIYIRVLDQNTGCPSIAAFNIHENLLQNSLNYADYTLCDINNDGTETFNLDNITASIIGTLPNINIIYYENEMDRDNGVNPIPNISYTPTSFPVTLYMSLTSPTCVNVEDITLDIVTLIEFPDLPQQAVCDEDQDGLTNIDLTQFDTQLYQNQNGFQVSYYETFDDANSNTNPVSTNYTNTSNPTTLYARITSLATFCADISSFEILVNTAPETITPSPLLVCDDDQDGMSIINLESLIPNIISSTSNSAVSFFNTLSDAQSGLNVIQNPTTFNTTSAMLIARVENTLSGCYSYETIEIIVNTLPVFPDIADFSICENNTDDIADFLLSSKDAEILNGQVDKQVIYFENENDAINLNNPIDKNSDYQNSTNPQTIFVRVQNITDIDCYGIDSFVLTVGTNPQFNEPVSLFICDDASNDTVATINIEEKRNEIIDGIPENIDVTFYATIDDVDNEANPITTDEYTTFTNPQEIYAVISNGSICSSLTSFTVNVIPVPTVLEIQPFEDCDTDYDGSISWNLTDAEINILDIRQDNVVVSYFESVENADNDIDPLPNPENYNNTSNPQTVFVKVTNTDFNCPLVLPIELNVNLPPAVNDFQSVETCDNSANTYDLSLINSIIVDNDEGISISYFSNAQDANSNSNAISTDYTYQTNNDIVYARVEYNSTNCFFVYPFMIVVNDLPIANTAPNLEACDDNFDEQLLFDLEEQTAPILGNQDNITFDVSYHSSETDAQENLNPLDTLYNATNNEVIYARVTNQITQCYSISQFNVIINPLPLVDIPDQAICPENFPLIVSAETGFTDDRYLWSTGETSPEIEITEIGNYSVTVTTRNGCNVTSEFNIIESEPATIEVVETVDFSDPNNITITVSGIGDYIFQLDGGEPQTTGIFENVNLGYHILTIIDQNGCASVNREVLVIDAPKFMTPNNDGDFDTWHIIGVETLPGTIVHIFDRYGKLLKQLNYNSRGWDGTYNGTLMQATDYWWSADVRQGNIEFTVKGHFALRR